MFFDKRERLWEFNNAAGILRFQIADPEYPLYTEVCNIYEGFGKVSL
jgi:hypothetical protein